MSTTITWTVTAMDCYPSYQADGNTYQDCVFIVHWTCAGTDGTYSASVYSTASIQFEDTQQTYVPYADLTQDEVLDWVWASGVDKTATEATVEQQIQNQINPPVVSPPLPWSN